jgi:hypothetical protein
MRYDSRMKKEKVVIVVQNVAVFTQSEKVSEGEKLNIFAKYVVLGFN